MFGNKDKKEENKDKSKLKDVRAYLDKHKEVLYDAIQGTEHEIEIYRRIKWKNLFHGELATIQRKLLDIVRRYELSQKRLLRITPEITEKRKNLEELRNRMAQLQKQNAEFKAIIGTKEKAIGNLKKAVLLLRKKKQKGKTSAEVKQAEEEAKQAEEAVKQAGK